MLTIAFGHLADAVAYALGEFRFLSATMATVRPEVTIVETGDVVRASTPDQVAISGVLESGALASLHLRGGRSRATNLFWDINGTDGDLLVGGESADVGNDESGTPKLYGARGEDESMAPLLSQTATSSCRPTPPPGPPFNVAQVYSQLASDIRNGARLAPSFYTAVRRHRMLDAVDRAVATGERQSYSAAMSSWEFGDRALSNASGDSVENETWRPQPE
jgi:predicted dehydrogenase